MRSLKSRLFGFGVAAFFGTIVVVGCSASGDDGEFTSTDTNEPDSDNSDKPISNGLDDDDDKDAGKKDSGKKDASTKDASTKDAANKDGSTTKDAGPAAPNEGDACTDLNKTYERACGTCGKQQALCLANSSGSGTVTAYGECKGQVPDGCTPGAVEDVACGNCGTEHRTCSNKCAWTSTGCQGQPTNSCIPGSVDYLQANCGGSTYYSRSCQSTCQWANFGGTCSAPPAVITVPSTVGVANSTLTVLDTAKMILRLSSSTTCPATISTSTSTPYSYVEVRNTNPKAVTVAIYNSQANGGPVIDTMIAAYDGTSLPADRKACKTKVGDTGTSALTGNAQFASLDAVLKSSVTIPANSSVMVYTAAYTASASGPVMVNVKTESIAP